MPHSIAQAALKYALDNIPKGICNQGSGTLRGRRSWTPVFPENNAPLVNGLSAFQRLKSQSPLLGCSMQDFLEYSFKVKRAGTGNCVELAALVVQYLGMHARETRCRVVALLPPGNHFFVVTNQEPDIFGYFPDNFLDWNVDAVVIDPWIGVCVGANHYPHAWHMKLDVMGGLGYEFPSAEGTAISANNINWYCMIEDARKFSFTEGLFSWL